MDLLEFYVRIQREKALRYEGARLGDSPDQDEIVVRLLEPSGVKEGEELYWVFHPSEVLKHDWDTLFAVLTQKRPARVIKHLARIVGYYSFTHNWNPSKLTELADRHKGHYDPEPSISWTVPSSVKFRKW